jgi:hypothetical protein
MPDLKAVFDGKNLDKGRPKPFDYLTGRARGTKRPLEITSPEAGGKFGVAGEALPFPGNTIICHIDPGSVAFAALCELQDALMALPSARHFTFLPKPSFHMTIFAGVSGSPLGSDGWPQGFVQAETLANITDEFLARLQHQPVPETFRIVPKNLYGGRTLVVEGNDDAEITSLRELRRNLQDITGIYRSSFAEYEFHITLAYLVDWLSDRDAKELLKHSEELYQAFSTKVTGIDLGRPEFCTFDTMHNFNPVAFLGLGGTRPPTGG